MADTLAQWLFYRYDHSAPLKGDDSAAWNKQPEENQLWWQHEADAVRRAVARGGFRTGPSRVEKLAGAWQPGPESFTENDREKTEAP